jgi:protein-L-isoaspartate(D-aspartate) O-methyltransferase
MTTDNASLVNALRAQGINDERVLDAIAATPREAFVEHGSEQSAYDDRALPISCGQTISQPYVVAYMTELLELAPSTRVLEIGTGSGYQTAILSRLAGEVYSVERHLPLLERARERFERQTLRNIFTLHGDGYKGWWEMAPFDRIVVGAAFRSLPHSLSEQLKIEGKLIVPLGYETISQRIWKMIRTQTGLQGEALLPVVFVPMIEGLPHEESTDDDDENRP